MTVMNFIRKKLGLRMKFRVHFFVEKYCKGKGIEIGGAASNPFNINAKNVDYSTHEDDIYRIEQLKLCGKVKKVDILARGDKLPLPDSSVDFVFSSHVIEHFYNPLSALREWTRVTKSGGNIVMLVPDKRYTFDFERDCTTIEEFRERDEAFNPDEIYQDNHHSVWTFETFLEFAKEFGFEIIDYVIRPKNMENSFGVVIRVNK